MQAYNNRKALSKLNDIKIRSQPYVPVEGTDRYKCKYCQFELDEERSSKEVYKKRSYDYSSIDLPSQILGEDYDCTYQEREADKIVAYYEHIPFTLSLHKIYSKHLLRTKPDEAPKCEKVRSKLYGKTPPEEQLIYEIALFKLRCKRHLANNQSPESPWIKTRLDRGLILKVYKIDMVRCCERILVEDEKTRYMEHIDSEYARYLKMRMEQLQELQMTGQCQFRMFQFKRFEFRPGTIRMEEEQN